jgi:hypothetical protein
MNQSVVAGLMEWMGILQAMRGDLTLQEEALKANEWFVPAVQQLAIEAVLPWYEGPSLTEFRGRYPKLQRQKRIGLILAGNLPLVGLHDVLVVVLSGHLAVVKPSHKDGVLLRHLVGQSPVEVQSRIRIVEAIQPSEVDFLIATGSNNTARYIDAAFGSVPHLIRQNRFSVAVLNGNESDEELVGVADDILRYHGLGCRNVSCVLVPEGYDWAQLAKALGQYPSLRIGPAWDSVLRYERAIADMLQEQLPNVSRILCKPAQHIQPGKMGILNFLTYREVAEVAAMLDAVKPDLQVVVGAPLPGWEGECIPFGQAQSPKIDDFADGVDTMALLTEF